MFQNAKLKQLYFVKNYLCNFTISLQNKTFRGLLHIFIVHQAILWPDACVVLSYLKENSNNFWNSQQQAFGDHVKPKNVLQSSNILFFCIFAINSSWRYQQINKTFSKFMLFILHRIQSLSCLVKRRQLNFLTLDY